MQQVGRTVIHDDPKTSKYDIKLSLYRRLEKKYYEFRIKFIDVRIKKYASYSRGYHLDLFNSYVYLKQSYLYRLESLYSKQELRDFEKRAKKNAY